MFKISTSSLPEKKTTSSQTEGIVTVITLTDGNQQTNNNEKSNSDKRSSKAIVSNLPHSKNASTSTREINSSSFNIGGTSSGGSSVTTGGAVSGANVGTVGVLSSNRNHLLGPVAVSGVTVSSSSKTSNTTLLSNQTIKQYQRQQHHPTVVVSGSNINSSTLPMQQQPHSNLLVSSSTSTTLPHGVSIVHTGIYIYFLIKSNILNIIFVETFYCIIKKCQFSSIICRNPIWMHIYFTCIIYLFQGLTFQNFVMVCLHVI